MGSLGWWTIRGMNSMNKQLEVKKFLNQNNVGLFGLLETKIKSWNWIKVKNNVCENWSICTNNSKHKGGRIWLIWQPTQFVVDVRVLVDAEWLQAFPDCSAHFLPEGLFDHCPCIIQFQEESKRKGVPFKYINMWPMVEEFKEVGANQWGAFVQGTPMFKVTRKLKMLKSKLKQLNKDNFSDIENITQVSEIALKEFHRKLIKDPLNKELCDSEALCAKELHFLKQARSQYLLQKSKENWMKDGDDNIAFYHASIKHRRMRNRVYQVKNQEGLLCKQQSDIQYAFEDFYKGLLGSSKSLVPINFEIVSKGNCLTDLHQDILLRGVTDEEVKTAMFSIPGNKDPSPDGYSSQFFKDTWHIIGKDVIHAVRSVFTSGKLLKSCISTILTLVPKVDVPEPMTQFRPIACCNTIYKCVAKVMCARLSLILPDIISPSQSAFIKGRDIVGNILLRQDLVKMYKRKACSPRIMMKIDLQKAYDSVECVFLQDMLKALNFPKLVIDILIFSNASGLYMNQGKSSIYSNGVDDHSMSVLAKLSGIKRDAIPFKFLGVSITPKRLGVNDCKGLIDKVLARIKGIGARKLSYAGRLVLIKSLLHNLHNYWARIFILSKTVLQKIDGLCRKFLWHGNEMKDSPALVAWENICKPKRKGGLGLKCLYWWNIAAVAKYTWWIAQKTDHL
ncbi:uncharacterized protein LOC141641001 [Silene latifolia]|uniref:uncharacterized protein LOC141641001 n=1 Tax=Silene latifolia TaxID=37657 RepID=UPI003D77BCCA